MNKNIYCLLVIEFISVIYIPNDDINKPHSAHISVDYSDFIFFIFLSKIVTILGSKPIAAIIFIPRFLFG